MAHKLEEALKEELTRDSYREKRFGEYHPSTISGCPLKAALDKMTDTPTILNSWMFQGSAVHHYVQNKGILDNALSRAGYDPLETNYEVNTKHRISRNISLNGTCDVLTYDEDGDRVIIDIKYSSLPAESGHGRIYKYVSQTNTYSYMFDADKFALLMIHSKSQDLAGQTDDDDGGIGVITGDPDEENWELVKRKAKVIHEVLSESGYDDDERWTSKMLESVDVEFWEDLMSTIPENHCPSYEKECDWCDHSDYCPVYQGKMGGVRSLVND